MTTNNINVEQIFSGSQQVVCSMMLMNLKQTVMSDTEALVKAGWDPDLIALLNQMPVNEISDIVQYSNQIFKFSVDISAFSRITGILRIKNTEEQLIKDLICANCPYYLITNYFGLTTNDIGKIKGSLGIETKKGRNKAATESEEIQIFEVTKELRLAKIREKEAHWYPRLLLDIFERTGIEISKILDVMNEQDAEQLI